VLFSHPFQIDPQNFLATNLFTLGSRYQQE